MIRLPVLVVFFLLAGCVSLPGSEETVPLRYTLQAPTTDCTRGTEPLGLGVAQVASGLATDRIAIVDQSSAEMSYLKDLRWVDNAGAMLQQRLASDLECRGRVVQTSHRARAGRDNLVCEVRALNLVRNTAGDQASIALSCLFRSMDGRELAMLPSARVPLNRWSGDAAVRALGTAYARMFEQLSEQLP